MVKRSALASGSPPVKPSTDLFLATCSRSFGMSSPLGLWTPPFQSVMATILAPA
jgi:hypothetical protein